MSNEKKPEPTDVKTGYTNETRIGYSRPRGSDTKSTEIRFVIGDLMRYAQIDLFIGRDEMEYYVNLLLMRNISYRFRNDVDINELAKQIDDNPGEYTTPTATFLEGQSFKNYDEAFKIVLLLANDLAVSPVDISTIIAFGHLIPLLELHDTPGVYKVYEGRFYDWFEAAIRLAISQLSLDNLSLYLEALAEMNIALGASPYGYRTSRIEEALAKALGQ